MAAERSMLPDLIAQRREAEGLTLRQVSRASGVSAATVCRVERGFTPDVASLIALCRWLGVSMEYAMTGQVEGRRCSACVRHDGLIRRLRRLVDAR